MFPTITNRCRLPLEILIEIFRLVEQLGNGYYDILACALVSRDWYHAYLLFVATHGLCIEPADFWEHCPEQVWSRVSQGRWRLANLLFEARRYNVDIPWKKEELTLNLRRIVAGARRYDLLHRRSRKSDNGLKKTLVNTRPVQELTALIQNIVSVKQLDIKLKGVDPEVFNEAADFLRQFLHNFRCLQTITITGPLIGGWPSETAMVHPVTEILNNNTTNLRKINLTEFIGDKTVTEALRRCTKIHTATLYEWDGLDKEDIAYTTEGILRLENNITPMRFWPNLRMLDFRHSKYPTSPILDDLVRSCPLLEELRLGPGVKGDEEEFHESLYNFVVAFGSRIKCLDLVGLWPVQMRLELRTVGGELAKDAFAEDFPRSDNGVAARYREGLPGFVAVQRLFVVEGESRGMESLYSRT
ncbi:hypothetical protein BC938DRAFT_475320 [Jimgerdemannia flammicorona]|uniref:F-box domain-containing protein n=1 Tax=Jimgerdemannia flammicorona TaxID=994334 RepID=A0A433QRR5_9FUNG|nr:hypothetical protein BC938DRAFT_475320 [Jimgerdemannia flammicorona]